MKWLSNEISNYSELTQSAFCDVHIRINKVWPKILTSYESLFTILTNTCENLTVAFNLLNGKFQIPRGRDDELMKSSIAYSLVSVCIS